MNKVVVVDYLRHPGYPLMFLWTVKTHKYVLRTLEIVISVILLDLTLIQQRIYKLKDLSGQLKKTNKRTK